MHGLWLFIFGLISGGAIGLVLGFLACLSDVAASADDRPKE